MALLDCFILFYLFFSCFGYINGKRHECDRLCLKDELSKTCFYQFSVGFSKRNEASEKMEHKLYLSINDKRAGPLISVCQNDTIIVDVRNNLPFGIETSIHWHGFSDGLSPFMDGVPMITQCPILPHMNFRYEFQAARAGTFYYHAHSVAQQLDGLHGPLVVHNEADQEIPSKTVMVSPDMKTIQTLEYNFEADLNITGLKLQFYSHYNPESKHSGPQRLRIINAAALDCPLTLFTHLVPLRVMAVDGIEVKLEGVNEVLINPGERVDLLVKPEVMQKIHIIGQGLCKGHTKYGFYPGISEESGVTVKEPIVNMKEMLEKLQPKEMEKLQEKDMNIFISYDFTIYKNFSGEVDFRYKLGSLTPYAPSFLTKNVASVLEVRNKTFLYPPSPLLSQPDKVPGDILCTLDNAADRCEFYGNGFCECVQIIHLPYNKKVDLFLIDEGKNGNTSQTVHIHGYSFYVLAMESFDKPINKFEIEEKESTGQIKRNLVNPIKKDTVMVPNKGYVILRLKTTYPGEVSSTARWEIVDVVTGENAERKWLLESTTSKAKMKTGLDVILSVGASDRYPEPPKGFPTCGTMKEPDLVFSVD